MNDPLQRRAFTLVELAIVLVIIGLLAGGVLAGQSLIRAAELRSITTDLSTIQTVINSFRDRYSYLPGDMPNATQFWGAAGTPSNNDNCYTQTNTDQRTCDGNGNGRIDGAISTAYPTPTTEAERGHFWKHLANAGLIEGAYAGYQGPHGAEIRRGGYNAKATKIPNTHWNAASINVVNPALDTRYFDVADTNVVEMTRDVNGAEVLRDILTPQELWNIDTKIDDGRPASGNVRGPKQGFAYAPNCTDNTTLAANYALATTTRECFPTIYLR